MENCISDKLLRLYLERACSQLQQEQISRHLKECQQCRKRFHDLQISQTRVSPKDETISAENADRTLSMPPVSFSGKPYCDITATLETMSDGYEILGELPRGGQAAIFKAIQKATKRIVAVKVLLQGKDAPKTARFRFEKEIELAASLRHPNIVTIYDSGIAQGQYYYAMEFIPGVPLDDYVKNNRLSIRQIMELVLQIASGVTYAHQKGVIHRDLKPGNILVDPQGKPHILDFGLAKILDTSSMTYEGSVMMSMTGQVLGTLAYMAPEQAAGKVDEVDVRTDVYALGVVLYKLLTGRFPYEVVGSVLEIVKNIQDVEPQKPSDLMKLDYDVEVIVLKALSKEAARRYQSASELVLDIDNWVKGYPILARADNSLYQLSKLIRRHRFAAAVVSLLLVIIVSFGAVSFYYYQGARTANLELQDIAQKWQTESTENLVLARRVLFMSFLQAWRSDNLQQAKAVSCWLSIDSKEAKGTAFLLSDKPLVQRIESLQKSLPKDQLWFADYMAAQYYLKNGDKTMALESFHKSANAVKDSKSELWYASQIQAALNTLDTGSKSGNNKETLNAENQ